MSEFDMPHEEDTISHAYEETRSRLSPGRIIDGILDYTRGRPTELTTEVGRSMRRNAVPLTLIGAGVLWMVAEGRREPLSRGIDRLRESAQPVIDKAREVASDATDSARETAREASRRIRDTTRGATDSAAHYSRRFGDAARGGQGAWRRVERSYQENPLALGVIVALGAAAVALSIPATRRENEWMGDLRDDAAEKIQETARSVREVGKTAYETAKEEAVSAGKSTLDAAKKEARDQGLDVESESGTAAGPGRESRNDGGARKAE